MAYEVSQSVKDALAKLTSNEKVQKALQFMVDDAENMIQAQMELALIPAPTRNEQKKAARMLEMLEAEGLTDCHFDEYGNIAGIRKGKGGGKCTIIEGHMDTVFPLDTRLEITRENGFIHCPGIVDDTRGCIAVLSTVRALNAAGIETDGDIHFVGTSREEGTGALGGMKDYVDHHPELEASVSVDGDGYQGIVFQATGIQTYEVTFHGVGGHAYGAYAKVANPIHAAGRFIAKAAEFRLPAVPKTTFEVTNLEAGNLAGVHAIVQECTIRFNFRANDQGDLETLRANIFRALDEACKEETERWGCDTITYTYKHIADVNVSTPGADSPIVQGAYAIAQYLGCEQPTLCEGGSTNCSRALERGIPAVCLGDGVDYDCKVHTIDEQFREFEAYKGCQAAMLLTLLCAGSEACETILD